MKSSLPLLALVTVLSSGAGLIAASPSSAAESWTPPAEPALVSVPATDCPATPAPGQSTCLAEARPASDATARVAGQQNAAEEAAGAGPAASADQAAPQASTQDSSVPLLPVSKSGSYTPSDLASLYRIPSNLAPTATIGIVDVGSDPNTQAQMSYFRSYFRLPACTTANGCFREVAQDGSAHLPGTNTDWVTETALDVQAVSAVCPSCHILLVDAATAGITDMAKAALTATQLGATYVSLSFGSAESIATNSLRATYYNNANVTYVAAAGDSGYSGGALFPASAPNIVAAGGTSVQLVNGVWKQSAWAGSGSGCSTQQSLTPVQSMQSLGTLCNGKRVVSDVSALADPNTGMLFYRGGSWWNGGGTSLAAPILASLYALAGNHTSPLSVYSSPSALVDVTSGTTGSCSPARLCAAGPGWDGPTGLGTPAGLGALAPGANLPGYVSGTSGTLGGGFGYPAKLGFHLADVTTGAGVPGATVTLQAHAAHASFHAAAVATTDGNGNIVFTVRPTAATTYRVVFGGDGVHTASTTNTLTIEKFLPTVKLQRLRGRLRVSVHAPWGTALSASTVSLQQRHGHGWRSVRKLRTNRHGVATAGVAHGTTYRLQYGGGTWRVGHTAAVKAR